MYDHATYRGCTNVRTKKCMYVRKKCVCVRFVRTIVRTRFFKDVKTLYFTSSYSSELKGMCLF